MAFTPRVICRPTGFLKIIEVTLAIICLILIRKYGLTFGGDTASERADRLLITYIAIGGMILVTLPLLIAYIFGEAAIEKTILEFMYNLIGFVLFIVAGSLLIHNYHDYGYKKIKNAALACGAVSIINGLVYLIDAVFSHRNRNA